MVVLVGNKKGEEEAMPKRLPCQRSMDHQIKLMHGIKPPTEGPYHMALP